MINLLRPASLLLSSLALTGISHATADAAVRVSPPEGCASSSAYTPNGDGWAKVTICLTEERRQLASGKWLDQPTDTTQIQCQRRWGGLISWDDTECTTDAKLTLAKDGTEVWTEDRSPRADPGDSYAVDKITDYYTCRGTGQYTLTLHHASASVVYKVGPENRRFSEDVALPNITVKANGC